MEQYLVSARKYRPSTFDSVVGQQALTGTLRNAIATGRLAHAYLFCGSRGVGKTSCARILPRPLTASTPPLMVTRVMNVTLAEHLMKGGR